MIKAVEMVCASLPIGGEEETIPGGSALTKGRTVNFADEDFEF